MTREQPAGNASKPQRISRENARESGRAFPNPTFSAASAVQENPDAELQGKLLAEDPNPIDTARRTLKKELKQKQARSGHPKHAECLECLW